MSQHKKKTMKKAIKKNKNKKVLKFTYSDEIKIKFKTKKEDILL